MSAGHTSPLGDALAGLRGELQLQEQNQLMMEKIAVLEENVTELRAGGLTRSLSDVTQQVLETPVSVAESDLIKENDRSYDGSMVIIQY